MRVGAALAIVMFAIGAWLGAGTLSTPEPLAVHAPSHVFAAARAFLHVTEIAREIHPMGSSAHDRVCNYLIAQLTALGLDVQTQEAVAVESQSASGARARVPWALEMGSVRNVLARTRGQRGARAVLLIAHYDSDRTSFGAADDGYGVAALLETARALSAGAPPLRDVIFLFTDGEERSRLGAAAFVREHPWRRDVDAAFNFDARGNHGPLAMFQSSDESGGLVSLYLHGAPHPVANSVSEEVYRHLDNYTDFDEMLEAGIPGLDFANFRGADSYHQPSDRAEAIDLGTLQHHGGTALALARSPSSPLAPRVAYFNLGKLVVSIPLAWMLPIALACAACLACLALSVRAARARAKERISLGDMGAGVGWAIGALSPAVILLGIELLLDRAAPGFAMRVAAVPLAEALYAAAGASLALAAALVMLRAWRRQRTTTDALALGAGALWTVIALALAIALPSASYLVLVPLCGFVPLVALRLWRRESSARWNLLGSALLLPGVMVVSLHVPLVVAALGSIVPAAALAGLWAGLATPFLGDIAESFGRSAARVLLAACVVGLGSTALLVRNVPWGPEGFRAYTLDADTHTARWVSTGALDPSCSPEAGWRQGRLPEFFPGRNIEPPTKDATLLSVTHPTVTVIDDIRAAGRSLRLRIEGARDGAIGIYLDRAATLARVQVEGRQVPLRAGQRLAVRFWTPPPEGLNVELELEPEPDASAPPSPIVLRIVTDVVGIPAAIAALDLPDVGARCFAGARTMVTKTFEL